MQDLNERLVYVGGAMVGAYATDPAATEPRTTIDVDCVVNSTSYAEHTAFEELLRQKHFQNDQTPEAPICRWKYHGEIVDVMSMDEKSQAFGNKWYRPGFELPSDDIERADMILESMMQMSTYKSQSICIQYVSDLHLEFPQNRQWLVDNPLEAKGEILLIAGDTAYLNLSDSKYDKYIQYEFWDWASEHYKQVIVCFGNHDFYDYYDLSTMPNGYCKEIRHNVHAYYNDVVHIDDIDIIVSTLWSKIEPSNAFLTERQVNDFYRIMYGKHKLTSDDFNREHERCLTFVKQAVAESHAKTKIVLTHHVPTQLCTAEEFRNSLINGAFTVELGNYIADSGIDYWIYGHSHRNINTQIGNTLIISNQLGYISHGEQLFNGFNPGKCIKTL